MRMSGQGLYVLLFRRILKFSTVKVSGHLRTFVLISMRHSTTQVLVQMLCSKWTILTKSTKLHLYMKCIYLDRLVYLQSDQILRKSFFQIHKALN